MAVEEKTTDAPAQPSAEEGKTSTAVAANKKKKKLVGFIGKFRDYFNASYPLLWIDTHEETRVIRELYAQYGGKTTIKIYEWDSINGLTERVAGSQEMKPVTKNAPYDFKNLIPKTVQLVRQAATENPSLRHLFIIKDFHPFIEATGIIRELRNCVMTMRSTSSSFVFVSPVKKIPPELEKEMQQIQYGYPGVEELTARFDMAIRTFIANCNDTAVKNHLANVPEHIRTSVVEAALGLTETEADGLFFLSLIQNGKVVDEELVKKVFEAKVERVENGGLLKYLKPDVTFDQLGGMEELKTWIHQRKRAYSKEAREYGIPFPKGCLLCGPPGTGKTALAKATAEVFGVPLFQLDIGALFNKYVGQTEQNFRAVIDIIESIGNCVLFIDEIEKALNKGAISGEGDTGTSSRSFATLLNWLSEHKSPVFTIATSNDHTRLPPELTRKGRLDELWWIDLPTDKERGLIFDVLVKRIGRDPKTFSKEIPAMLQKSDGFTGAEMEQGITSALYAAFDDNMRPLTMTDIFAEFDKMTPFSRMSAAELLNMRQKAQGKLRPVNSTPEAVVTKSVPRRRIGDD